MSNTVQDCPGKIHDFLASLIWSEERSCILFWSMEETKRWIVTYTKHLRQKRKVYQDGTIELHRPSNKVLLYDDSSKLLDNRLLRKDELIECGVTLTFETHLVDIGELDETHNPLQDMHADGSHGKSKVKVGRVQKFEVKKNPRDIDRSTNISANDVRVKDSEWDVLYTAQVTQKAKRYHDGVLRRVTCGSHMAQLILLKEDGSTLSTKFQKLSECLVVGNTYEMPNYLVEICAQRNSSYK
ncbi:unnamed protein product [Spirodela intermedia]|uniref:5'-3' DNA helicase ZGRF1-like N-terminal domain-containing protein n=1 Tax=Spirodela intermedia TaxID=51605 RepID=A0A7I8L1E9_SPIIN|nr:unnamed protein product [Spirodela intermedia]